MDSYPEKLFSFVVKGTYSEKCYKFCLSFLRSALFPEGGDKTSSLLFLQKSGYHSVF